MKLGRRSTRRSSNLLVELHRRTGEQLYALDFHEDLIFESTLGEGAFGRVDCYTLKPVGDPTFKPVSVAVKRLKVTTISAEAVQEFFDEITLMKLLDHPNVVKFLGSGTYMSEENVELPFLCQEMLKESLQQKLQSKKYSAHEAISWCLDIAKGMQYLHTRRPTIVHRDLKPNNILLTDQGSAKVIDFGLFATTKAPSLVPVPPETPGGIPMTPSTPLDTKSPRTPYTPGVPQTGTRPTTPESRTPGGKRFDQCFDEEYEQLSKNGIFQHKIVGNVGSYKYMAPENFADQPYCEKVDVYSFSMVMYSLLTKREPHDGLYLAPHQIASAAVKDNLRPKLKSKWPDELKCLIKDCWNGDPTERISFGEIIHRLEELMSNPHLMAVLERSYENAATKFFRSLQMCRGRT
ncbi:hypothetical protein CYMTET_37467 [Cymbomonas tetramitiformis]|uniref:Protein kinase domain-containing protein n=1 Tax=Cymbomonas tetramitiformis TaxID=36881 RepID=A0AAE0CDX0_9CHLO|nr:hypothetical protein CYMTET_37467 [Cymbomonas tetramitiformis]